MYNSSIPSLTKYININFIRENQRVHVYEIPDLCSPHTPLEMIEGNPPEIVGKFSLTCHSQIYFIHPPPPPPTSWRSFLE